MSLTAEVTLSNSSSPRLANAILIYEDAQAKSTFATLHDVRHQDDDAVAPELGPARLLTMEAARKVLDALTRSRGVPFLPGNTLAIESGLLAWYEPAAARRMWFQSGDEYLNALSGQEFTQPPLVFIARGRALNVYALAGDARPTPDTPLYMPPYLNTFADARVCLGSTKLPDGFHPDDQDGYAEVFFRSAFTHVGGQNPLRGWEHSYGEFWQHVKALGRFPTEHLRPANTTLGRAFGGD